MGQEDVLEKGQTTHSSKETSCNAGDLVRSLGWEDPLEKGKATHSSILAWRTPWTWGRKESDITEQLSL